MNIALQASSASDSDSAPQPEQTPGGTSPETNEAFAPQPRPNPWFFDARLHAVECVEPERKNEPPQFVPIRFIFRNKLTRNDRLLAAFDALVLSHFIRCDVNLSKIVHGDEHGTLKLKTLGVLGEVRKLAAKMLEVVTSGSLPDLVLNRHCGECEFRDRCRQNALQVDDLSLLSAMTEKERTAYRRKGIFTLKQLSYTFRPRRTPKRAKNPAKPHYLALQALAIREKTVYIHGSPQLPKCTTQVYVDIEGLPDRDFYYLISALIVRDGKRTLHTFWADHESDQPMILTQFIQVFSSLQDFRILHFGGYEEVALKRMRCGLPKYLWPELDLLLERTANVLSIVHPHIYFPVYSNTLKNIGACLNTKWTNPNSTGLQSILWRLRWEASQDPELKATLITYNHEDCAALMTLCDFILALPRRSAPEASSSSEGSVKFADELPGDEETTRNWTNKKSAFKEYDKIIKCAYFDYQRSKIYVRTDDRMRKIARQGKRRELQSCHCRVNERVEFRSRKCIYCNSPNIRGQPSGSKVKKSFDLRFFTGGMKRWVTSLAAQVHMCLDCKKFFLPYKYRHQKIFGHNLMAWAMQQHVCNRITFEHIAMTAKDCFNLPIPFQNIQRFKGCLADYYASTYRRLVSKVTTGKLLHVDETAFALKQDAGYVWVFTTMEDVVYVYRPNREAQFLHPFLRRFHGVLITDFYTGYDSLKCAQQKCLIHLIRDVNDDLLKNPLDHDLSKIGLMFGNILRDIVGTIDQFGLKSRWLKRHKAPVEKFFESICNLQVGSETAEALRRRMLKNRTKLFAFLDYDGIPWNNNNAEHAIKPVAKYRRLVKGRVTEAGLTDYLVLLSIQQTCDYKGISFLEFLLSKEKDIDKFFERHA